MPLEMIPLALRGMSDQEPIGLPDGASPDMLNVRLFNKKIMSRPGTLKFEQDVEPPTGKNLIQVGFGANAPCQFVMLDTNKLARYNSLTNLWDVFTIPAGEEDGPEPPSSRFSVANTLGNVVYGSPNTRLRNWDGTTLTTLVTDLGQTLRALVLLAFNNRVVAVHPSLNGVDEPVNIRWCVNGNLNLWDPANDGAGLLQVVETSEMPLTGGFVLGGRAYLTKQFELNELVATGNLDEVFRVEPRVVGKGMIAPYSWAANDYFGFFLGNDNVYMWDGSNLVGVGDEVKTSIFDQIGATALNQYAGGLLWVMGMVNPRRQEYWLYIPYGPDRISKLWIYNWHDKQWYQDQYPMTALQGMGVFSPSQLTTPSVLGPGSMEFNFDCVVLNIADGDNIDTGVRRLVLFDNIRLDGGTPTSAGVPFTKYVTTKDYLSKRFGDQGTEVSLEVFNNLRYVVFQGLPDERIQVAVSVDQGTNWASKWVQIGPRKRGFGFFNKSFTTCRFRLLHDGDGEFSLTPLIQYKWKPAGVVIQR